MSTPEPSEDDVVITLADLIHGAVLDAGFDCPDRGGAVLCREVAARLIAAGVRPPGGVS